MIGKYFDKKIKFLTIIFITFIPSLFIYNLYYNNFFKNELECQSFYRVLSSNIVVINKKISLAPLYIKLNFNINRVDK